ncbi:MAG: IclR family transcriptional regulator [Pseudomonadota bacterium]|nr:IclR family transcriptional regulator [Pseudomonadota bacterium]
MQVTAKSRSIRVMSIVEAVARSNGPLRISELVEQCKLPKATVHRICGLLCKNGYLQQELGGKGLEPGIRLRELAQSILAGAAGKSARHAVLESVARQVGETCNLAMPDGTRMYYLDRVETEWPLKVQLPIGTRVPLHCTAGGKLYLSSLPSAQRARVLDRLELDKRTPNTITDRARLEAALRKIAETRVGTDDEEFIAGMVAIAVPVTDVGGRVFATLAIHGPTVRFSLEAAMRHVNLLRAAASEISAAAGDSASASSAPSHRPGLAT